MQASALKSSQENNMHYEKNIFEIQATIIKTAIDERGSYIVCNDTPFYPQGGGQSCDKGHIKLENSIIQILHVSKTEGEIRHYVDSISASKIGQIIELQVDEDYRLFNSKLHSGGHLISDIIERNYPNLREIKASHMLPCYIKYEFISSPQELDLAAIHAEIDKLISQNLTLEITYVEHEQFKQLCPNFRYELPSNQAVRLVKIDSLPPCPCCGTHVKCLKDLHGLKITRQKLKGNELTIFYEIG